MKISIIMPTYNEAANIGRMVEVLAGEEFPKINNPEMHLIIVDKNSPDGTGDIVRKKMEHYPNVHLLTIADTGLGLAYVKGVTYAMGELDADAVMEMDADFQHDPRYVKHMVSALFEGADYVIGSRYIPEGSIPANWSWYRKTISRYGNRLARLVLRLPDLHDFTTGFRLTRVRGVLDKIDVANLMELDRFAYKVDLLYKTARLSAKTVEVPINFEERTKERTKFNLKEILATLKVLFVLRIKESRLWSRIM